MPRKIKDIKEIASMQSLGNIHDDPAQNSVLGNIKKLHTMLGEFKDEYAISFLRDRLEGVLDGAAGKYPEADTDKVLDILHAPLQTVYILNNVNNLKGVKDEQKKKDLKNLLEYVAAGLDNTDGFQISDEQKRNIKHRENQEKVWVRQEKAEAEERARWKAVEGKSALNVLDEHKAALGKLPKSFSGPDAKAKETEAREQLKALCIDIMATRRAVEAKRNDKSGLAKAQIHAGLLKTNKETFSKSKALNSFLDKMPYKDLLSLASSGHGGAMEVKFMDHVRKNSGRIPADTPYDYMPTAKQRTEALIDKMKSDSFHLRTAPGDQRKVYIELLATRAAVNSIRGKKSSLSAKPVAATINEERKKFAKEPLNTALVRITQMGEKQESAWEAATSGHGGALEDKIRRELRRMAVEKENGYKLQSVDTRFAPTKQQRFADLHSLITSEKMSDEEILRVSTEAGILKDEIDAGRGDEPIEKIDSYNRQIDSKVALYSKVMDYQSLKDYVMNSVNKGNDFASGEFESVHAGPLAAIRLEEKINSSLEKGAGKADLEKLAAQKMTLLKAKMQYQEDKDGNKLADALDKTQLEKDVTKLMKHHLFKEMCEKLGPEGLTEYAKGTGEKLVESFELAREDKLQPYKPEVPAAKNGKGPKEAEVPQGPIA